MKCVISCEHASNRVPPRFARVFNGKEKILSTHQAYDHGAAKLARKLAKELHAPVHLGAISRLLVDLNRSPTNRKTLFTQYSKKLEHSDRQLLLTKYFLPYREKVETDIGRAIARGRPVLHISVHSFSPVKRGKERNADIGLLYDPVRKHEKEMCVFLVKLLQKNVALLQVRRNYPYLGKTDGFTSFLRRKHPGKLYAGIEIELNQALVLNNDGKKGKALEVLTEGIKSILLCSEFSQLAKIKSE